MSTEARSGVFCFLVQKMVGNTVIGLVSRNMPYAVRAISCFLVIAYSSWFFINSSIAFKFLLCSLLFRCSFKISALVCPCLCTKKGFLYHESNICNFTSNLSEGQRRERNAFFYSYCTTCDGDNYIAKITDCNNITRNHDEESFFSWGTTALLWFLFQMAEVTDQYSSIQIS